MISCTEFIPAYSELFRFIQAREGHEGVRKYWENISDLYVWPRLGTLVLQHGIRGCYEYWSHSLNEEAADFLMTLDEDAGIFTLEMRACPSKGMLLALAHMEPYPFYCSHCDLLYRRVLEKLGYIYEFTLPKEGKASCRLTVQDPRCKIKLHNSEKSAGDNKDD